MSECDNQESTRGHQDPGLGFFSDFEKPMKDVLFFELSNYLRIWTRSDTGLELQSYSSTTLRQRSSNAIVSARYKSDNDDSFIVGVSTHEASSAILELNRGSLPSLKNTLILTFPDYKSSTHQVQYFKEHAALSMSVPWCLGFFENDIHLSATIGTPQLAFGMDAKYNFASRGFRLFDSGITTKMLNSEASITLTGMGDLLRASYVHHFGQKRKVAASGTIWRRFTTKWNGFIVGGSWFMDKLTKIMARIDTRGKMTTVLEHEFIPKSKITITTEFDIRDLRRTPTIGVGLTLSL